MKLAIFAFIISLIGFASPVYSKTTVEVLKQNNADGSSIIAIKELRGETDALGVVFICKKDSDEAHVVIIAPKTPTGDTPTIGRIQLVKWKNGKEFTSLTPIDTAGSAMWNLQDGFSVMSDTSFASSYSIRFYDDYGMIVDETRRIPDSEFKRLLDKSPSLKSCEVTGYDDVESWDYYSNFPFSVYAKYK